MSDCIPPTRPKGMRGRKLSLIYNLKSKVQEGNFERSHFLRLNVGNGANWVITMEGGAASFSELHSKKGMKKSGTPGCIGQRQQEGGAMRVRKRANQKTQIKRGSHVCVVSPKVGGGLLRRNTKARKKARRYKENNYHREGAEKGGRC